MPELPDVTIYIEALERFTRGRTIADIRIKHPFLLRSVDPPVGQAVGRVVRELRRLGKRICIGLDGDLWLVIHLMIAGRLHWQETRPGLRRKIDLAALDFEHGSVLWTEAGTQKRASLHLVRGEDLARHDPGGLEILATNLEDFRSRLVRNNHTLKRALTSPRLFSGIGNAFSDEILHRARLSPIMLTQRLTADQIESLFAAACDVLRGWVERLRRETGDGFPEKVTAFREGMAVHGRYGKPCPVCQAPVQRIRYASNETNYCAACQTDGKVLADRSLSRLLRKDWPRTLEEWEAIHETQS